MKNIINLISLTGCYTGLPSITVQTGLNVYGMGGIRIRYGDGRMGHYIAIQKDVRYDDN